MQKTNNNLQNFKVYIINLDKDIERMEFMTKQMQELDMEYERAPAIYGKEYDFGNEYDEKLAIQKNGKALVLGELGCAKSHKLCYEKILNEDSSSNMGSIKENKIESLNKINKYYLILEDDVSLPRNFKEIIERQIELNEFQKNLKNKDIWNYLLFDYPRPGKFFIYHWVNSLFLNYKLLNKSNLYRKAKFIIYSFIKACYILPMAIYEWLRDIYYRNNIYKKNKDGTSRGDSGKAVRFYRPLYLAGAYLITNDTAKTLLKLNTPIIYPADRVPDEARKQLGMKFYAYTPLCVYQKRESFGSSILGVKFIKEIPIKNI